MRKIIRKWGIALVALGGWIATGCLVMVMASGERNFDVVNEALTKSLLERSVLSKELDRVRGQLEATQNRLAEFEDQISRSQSKLAGLPEPIQQELAAGRLAKYMTTKRAKLRLGPSTDSQELAILSPKIPLEVLGLADNGQWLEVVRFGYVHNELLRPMP